MRVGEQSQINSLMVVGRSTSSDRIGNPEAFSMQRGEGLPESVVGELFDPQHDEAKP